ncbi:MAG: ABC transporter permease [Lachnospiraceae bacterium]|nr:ABC transporter permease [Lachnospiraceae bacterium]
MLIENMAMAFSAIRANKMRSILTMLGIVIGIGSVISIVSIGDTMRRMFSDIYKDIGVTQAFCQVKSWMVDDWRQSDMFTLDEMEQVKEVFGDEIAYIDSNAGVSGEAVYGRNKVKFTLSGIDYNFREVQPVTMLYGRYLNEGDILDGRMNAVMEAESAERLFGTENAVGKTFRTTVYGNVEDFHVVGVYKKEVSPFQALMMGSGDDSGTALIPYTILTFPNDYFDSLHVYASEEVDLVEFYSRFTRYIAKKKGRSVDQIYTYTAAEEMGSIDQMMGGLSVAVGGIAAISLVVGGIGIMNIMLVSVTERTREIGIRKALGAKTRDVMIQFLTESATLSAMGGIIGILIGTGLVSLGGMALGVPVVVKPGVVILAVGFSAVVGIFFGLYPASKAAKADPIEALRYE